MAIEKVLPGFKWIGGKLVQAIKGAPKVTKAPTTTSASTTISRMPAPVPSPIILPKPAPGFTVNPSGLLVPAKAAGQYADDAATVAANRLIKGADDLLTQRPSGILVPRNASLPNVVDDVVEAATRSRRLPILSNIPRPVKTAANVVGQTAAFLAPGEINKMQAEGKNVPGWVEAAANLAALGATGAGAKSAYSSVVSKTGREALKNAGKGAKALTALGAAGATYGVTQVPTFVRNIFGAGTQVPAAADSAMLPDVQVLNPADAFGTEEAIDTSGMTQEDLYFNEVYKALDVMTQNAQAQASQAMADIDAEYENEMKAIDADYKSRQQQISNIYSEALNQIDDYTAQANQLLRETAEASQAGYEAAAGGMQNLQAPTGLTAEEAALSGVSPTALGGGAITNAALTRSLAGAAQAAAAAQRFATGVDLGGEAAATRGIQADTLAALERSLLETQTSARRTAAADRQSIREQEAAAKAAAATLESDARLKVAEMVGTMTPEQLAAWRGSSASKRSFKAPSYYGKYLAGADDAPIKLALAESPATVGTVNTVLDSLYANLNTAEARNPATAQNFWQEYFDTLTPDARKVLAFRGLPTTGGKMYAELFPTTPSK